MAAMEEACKVLLSLLPGRTCVAGQPDYVSYLSTYYSAQASELSPACIVAPTSSSEVSTILKTLTKFGVKFAVRGGGHTLNAGASNIDSGVVISLRSMNTVVVNEDRTLVTIGGGAKWREVYSHLDPLEIATSGGRVADVGVGGLATGGGISYFSANKGLVCDNITAYEVVVSSGEIIIANQEQNDDLFKALKGGSSNFGIVTAFTIRCFPQSTFYGGVIIAPVSTVEAQFQGFVSLLEEADPHAAIMLSVSWNKDRDSFFIFENLQYTQPVEEPNVLKPFLDAQPQFINTMRISTLGDFVQDGIKFAIPPGQRNQFATTTFRCPDVGFLDKIYSLFKASLSNISKVEGINWAMVVQPFPLSATNPSVNCLGLSPKQGPLVLFLLAYNWADKSGDETVNAAAKELITEIDNFAQESGNGCGFMYLNYAASWQDPIAGYGDDSVKFLREVSEKYDPEGVFWKLCTGGFKIPR